MHRLLVKLALLNKSCMLLELLPVFSFLTYCGVCRLKDAKGMKMSLIWFTAVCRAFYAVKQVDLYTVWTDTLWKRCGRWTSLAWRKFSQAKPSGLWLQCSYSIYLKCAILTALSFIATTLAFAHFSPRYWRMLTLMGDDAKVSHARMIFFKDKLCYRNVSVKWKVFFL